MPWPCCSRRPGRDKVGVVGYCMGGGLALVLATQRPDAVAAAAPYYGAIPWASVQPDWSALTAKVVGEYAELDGWASPEAAHALEAQLRELGKDATMHVHPGADHAFFNDARPEVYDAAASASRLRPHRRPLPRRPCNEVRERNAASRGAPLTDTPLREQTLRGVHLAHEGSLTPARSDDEPTLEVGLAAVCSIRHDAIVLRRGRGVRAIRSSRFVVRQRSSIRRIGVVSCVVPVAHGGRCREAGRSDRDDP